MINWRTDSQGAFELVVLRTQTTYQEDLTDDDTVNEEQWLYLDRENFQRYSRKRRERAGGGNGSTGIIEGVELIDQGRHGLADLRRVPLVKMAVTDGLWLANKASLLQQEHFNKSNALSWACTWGCSQCR